ncbi:spinster family MFS transporter [Amycolatopsis sp. CA-126428]|uniref:spinster family MFS transporter n=1 Tax=Amycolatopsis sp. CA-126428 TaxID=2073158 RepID=UPI0018EA5C01|nr:MFS transporter [Amycolatopsis sp. CA-126428]
MATEDQRRTALDPLPRATSRAGWVLALLFAANLLNFYDRTIPSILVEPIKAEFGLSDAEIGLISAAFTVVYAVVGIPLGRLADHRSRRVILSAGLAVWSLLTAVTGLVGGFAALVVVRLLLGMGEASFAPATNSLVADLYPPDRRARATGQWQLGLPVGLVLAFFTVGSITEAFGSWRAAFFVAAVPGLAVAGALAFIREPARGASESAPVATAQVGTPFRSLMRVPTLWWLVVAGLGSQIASYAVATFSVPLFQRHFGTSLAVGGAFTGVTIGVTGLVGLTVGGRIADRAGRRSPAGRVLTGAYGLLGAVPLTAAAFLVDATMPLMFVVVFSAGWLLQYLYFTAAYPTVADVVEPRLRGTAMALYFAASYLLGGALGPLMAGALSDRFAASARDLGTRAAAAYGLHLSLAIVIPVGLLIAAVGLFVASKCVARDRANMRSALRAAR